MTLSLTISGACVIAYFSEAFAASDLPDLPTCLGVNREQMRVDGSQKERVAENRESAADAAAASSCLGRWLIGEGPEHPSGDAVERHDFVAPLNRRPLHGVKNSIDGQGSRLEFFQRLGLPDPLQLEVFDIRGRDLRQRTVALVEEGSRVGEPVVWLALGSKDAFKRHLLRLERRGCEKDDPERTPDHGVTLPFNETR